MATERPVVSVYQHDDPSQKSKTVVMPRVLASPLRPDLVRFIHMNMSKNKRQAYALSPKAGYGTAAESWGTGRAVARIPRVPGGGTHRAGQAAFGNMCRGGGMFSPTKVWRRWHRKINVTMKRHAVATALAASSLPPLVMARGHRIGEVRELPLVVSDGAQSITKTKQAVALLKGLGAGEELDKIMSSRKVRGGVSKLRNRKYSQRKGPLVVYAEDSGLVRAFRNIPGVETACVDRLNLLKLAPGASFGRFVIWTESAFNKLNEMYGTAKSGAPLKKGYFLPRAAMENADVARIINSDEVQSVLRPKLDKPRKYAIKKNPLKNAQVMARLNPGILQKREARKRAHVKDSDEQKVVQKQKKATEASHKKVRKQSKEFYGKIMGAFDAARAKLDAEKKAAAAALLAATGGGDDEE